MVDVWPLGKKGIAVWIFSSLSVLAILHVFDAISALVLNNQIGLLQLYPFISEVVQTLNPTVYYWASIVSAGILWGITCLIAFNNPLETYLNHMISDAEEQNEIEGEVVQEKSELLDAMNETILGSNLLLGEIKDWVCNIRAEVKEIQPLKECMEQMKMELSNVRKNVDKLREIKFLKNIQPKEDDGNRNLETLRKMAKI